MTKRTPLSIRRGEAVLDPVARMVRRLDRWLRLRDFAVNRTIDGVMARYGVPRHTIAAVALPAVLVFFMINGPAVRPSWRLAMAIAGMFASAVPFALALRYGERRAGTIRGDLASQCALLALIGAAIWLLAPEAAGERSPSLVYRHVLVPVALLTATAALLAAALAGRLFGSSTGRANIQARLARVELFVSPQERPAVTLPMLLLAAYGAVTSSPGRVLFPACLAALFVERELVILVFGLVFVANLILLAFANLDPRFSASWQLLHRIVFGGWAAVVSWAVIAIGLCRVADIQYVSTVFDGARNYTLGGYIAAAYVLAWWHDYWISTFAAIRFLDLLGGTGAADDAMIEYRVDPDVRTTSVPADERVIRTHGAGRLLVYRQTPGGPRFHSYSPTGIADALANGLDPKDPCRLDLDWAKWRLDGHFLLTSTLVVVLFGGAGYLLHRLPQQPHIAAPPQGGNGRPVAAATVLLPAEACSGSRPLIAVAASGGGTRAALYTASVLERLQREGQLANVRVMSGVSGGGAALAYFVANRRALIDGNADAWQRFYTAMKQPYIEDVIDGSGEWRIASGVRLGRLLAESFDRRWTAARWTMGEVDDVGLLLNSSVAGRFIRDRAKDGTELPLADVERQAGRGLSDVAGGRVVFTNLDLPDHFGNPVLIEEDSRETRETRLPVFVVNGSHVRLSDAAAANANFPPVFSNAPIDRDADTRYWVTDGGAVDNRGLETLLMTIRYALADPAASGCATPPPLHIVEIEASAFSDGYRQDRGVGSMMAAGTAFASQLDAELLEDIRRRYGSERVRFHYMPMPALLRRSGSFGTHWMMQERINVCHDPACSDSYSLKGDDVEIVLRALDKRTLDPIDGSEADEAHTFIVAEEPMQAKNWDRLASCLRSGC